MNEDILNKLEILANKWKYAQPDVYETCIAAIHEIHLLREIQKVKNEYGSQGFSCGAD